MNNRAFGSLPSLTNPRVPAYFLTPSRIVPRIQSGRAFGAKAKLLHLM